MSHPATQRGFVFKNWHQQRIRMRAYAIWEEEGRQHGNDLAHWFRAGVEVPLRVTFDSNTYRQVLSSGPTRDASSYELKKINEALRSGRMRGYLSETILSLEGIQQQDRANVLGSTRIEVKSRTMKKNIIEMTIAMRQDRKPLNPLLFKWISAAQEFGLGFLQTGSRWFSGAGHIPDDAYRFFEPDGSVLALAERMDRINRISESIQAKGIGYARAVNLGLEFSARDGKDGEWWLQGLKRAASDQEQTKVILAVREWADADSVAAHIGYELDVFCSEDKGKRAGGDSILNDANKTWLDQTYGVKFVNLRELAEIIG